ncbi:hypothetical protein ONR75_17635 [Rhodopseudomonas sp. P2A-2r]|nr:hypothetical protein ONR75_17635 [Rhodopseudomonas sp. P2A-2r]
MRTFGARRVFLMAAVIAAGISTSIVSPPGEGGGMGLSIGSAQARVGRPLTPLSGAGVARRTVRRHVYRAQVVAAPVVVAPACVRVRVNGVYVCR